MNFLFFLALCGGDMAIASMKIAHCAAAFGIGITLASILLSLRQRSLAWTPLYGSVLLLHPAWTMSVDRGDCGDSMRFLAVAASLTLLVILICQVFWPRFSRRRFILSLCLASWAAYLVDWPLDRIVSYFELTPDFEGGFAAQAVRSTIMAEKDLLMVALALTFVCLLQGLFNRIRNKRSPRATATQEGRENAGIEQGGGVEVVPNLRLGVPLRASSFVLSLVLLGWVLLSVLSRFATFGANPLFSIFALVWSATLMIAAVRGRFPGWS